MILIINSWHLISLVLTANVIFIICFNLSVVLGWIHWWPVKFWPCEFIDKLYYKIISELAHIYTHSHTHIYICCCLFSLSDSCGGCGHKWSCAFTMPCMSPHICKQSQPVGTCQEWAWRWSRTIQLFCVWSYCQE
jgi:hypothetical protein